MEPTMNTLDNDPLHAAINAQLTSIVASMAARPAWYDAWLALGPESTEQQRLDVYQAIRDSGVLPPEAGFYLVSWQIDAITSQLAEEALRPMDDELAAIQAAHGLGEDEFWRPGEAPEEYEQLRLKYQDAWDKLFAEQLKAHGEQAMAELFQADPDAFQQRSHLGWRHFHGPDDPEGWLNELGEAVAATMTADSGMGPLGFRYYEDDGCWVVVVYPRPVELVGGAEDGEVVSPGFSLDLEELRSLFDRVDACCWQALALNYDEGPHVSIEGLYQGHEVFLQVLACAPNDEQPGAKMRIE
jgi:hypothetical protein